MHIPPEVVKRAIYEVQSGEPRYFMENLLMVASKRNELVPFKFNRLQELMYEKTTGRDYWLKFRQGGSSLFHLGVSLATAMCVPYYSVAIITLSTDNGKQKARLFRHVKRFIESMPESIRPETGHDRVDYVDFPKLDSQIYIGTVGTEEFARGETISRLVVTELGSFTDKEAHNVLTSAVESVVPDGTIVFETTPKTAGSYAHGFYEECKSGDKPYTANFIPWYWAEDYFLVPGAQAALPRDRFALDLTPEEETLVEKFLPDGIPVQDRIRWRRMKVADRSEDFYSEYPENDVDCWAARTNSVFPADRIRAMLADVREPMEVVDGNARIYKESSALRRYVVGLDAAGGIPGGDYSTGVIQCVETGDVVAVFHGLVGGDELARAIATLSLRYGKAMCGGERDAWTKTLMETLEGLGVPCYYHEDGKLGFPNTNTSRMQGIVQLKSAMNDGDFAAYDKALVHELSNYERTTDTESKVETYGAPKGQHDDLCVGAQRAQQMRLTMPGQSFFNRQVPQESLVGQYEQPTQGF